MVNKNINNPTIYIDRENTEKIEIVYKGTSKDIGMFYAPYVPLMVYGASINFYKTENVIYLVFPPLWMDKDSVFFKKYNEFLTIHIETKVDVIYEISHENFIKMILENDNNFIKVESKEMLYKKTNFETRYSLKN
jgi:hypothetical protein